MTYCDAVEYCISLQFSPFLDPTACMFRLGSSEHVEATLRQAHALLNVFPSTHCPQIVLYRPPPEHNSDVAGLVAGLAW